MTADQLRKAEGGLDLEQFRQAKGLSYRRLAALIGQSHASKTRAWAIGETRPDADELEFIIRATDAEVTVEAMHQRRLAWLMDNKKCSVPQNCAADGADSDR